MFAALAVSAGESAEQFKELYSSWMFYVTILEIIVLTAYAGFEFDMTFTQTEPKNNPPVA